MAQELFSCSPVQTADLDIYFPTTSSTCDPVTATTSQRVHTRGICVLSEANITLESILPLPGFSELLFTAMDWNSSHFIYQLYNDSTCSSLVNVTYSPLTISGQNGTVCLQSFFNQSLFISHTVFPFATDAPTFAPPSTMNSPGAPSSGVAHEVRMSVLIASVVVALVIATST